MNATQETFVRLFKTIQYQVHQTALEKGWWEQEREIGTLICLMHSELSEAMEAARKNAKDDKLPWRFGLEVELADCIIRIMDFAQRHNLDVAGAIVEKAQYNETRAYKHGGKEF